MPENIQGDLANLWAVGGKQVYSKKSNQTNRFYLFCPNCGWKLTGKFFTCPRCGVNLSTVKCPYCGGVIPAKAEECPHCTGPLK